jgi:hypothetical protein
LYTFKDAGVTGKITYKYNIETILPDGSVEKSKPLEIIIESKKKPEKPDVTPQPESIIPAGKL